MTLLVGAETVLRRRRLREIVAIATDQGDFDYEEFPGDSDPGRWASAALTAPFLGDRRTVIVRNVLRAGDPGDANGPFKGLDATFKAFPETAALVLVADDEPGDDDAQSKWAPLRKKWTTYVTKLGGSVENFDVDAKNVKVWLKNELANQGKKMSERALNALVEMTGGSLSRALEELEKLTLYVGDEEQIGEAEVNKLVVASREYKVYALIQGALAGSPGEALQQLAMLADSPTKLQDAAFGRIFPLIRTQLRLLWQARTALDAKANIGDPPAALLALWPAQGRLDQEADWKRDKSVQLARKYSLAQIAALMRILDETDAQLKGGDMGLNARDALERMTLRMVKIGAPN